MFSIWNDGQPFSDEALKNAAKFFFTEHNSRSEKHYGIGLSFAKGIAEKHHGGLRISNPSMGGAEVILSIKKYRSRRKNDCLRHGRFFND